MGDCAFTIIVNATPTRYTKGIGGICPSGARNESKTETNSNDGVHVITPDECCDEEAGTAKCECWASSVIPV
jgi:hypothetical protein